MSAFSQSVWHQPMIFLLMLLGLFSVTSADCTTYSAKPNRVNTDGGPYTSIGRTNRVSEILNCTSSGGTFDFGGNGKRQDGGTGPTECPDRECRVTTPANYFIEAGSTLNVSTNADTYNSIMKLLKKSVQTSKQVDWNGTMAYSIGQSTYSDCIDLGQAGFIGFTPYTLCTEGILTGCSGDAPADNTPIQACGTILLDSRHYDGEVHLVSTDAAAAAVPANATIPDNSANVPGNGGNSLRVLAAGNYAAALVVAVTGSMLLF